MLSGQVLWSGFGALACFSAAWILFDRFTEYVDRSNPARGLLPRVRSRRLLRVARPWRWALVLVCSQMLVMMASGSGLGLLPLGLVLLAILSLPAVAIARFGARMRLRAG